MALMRRLALRLDEIVHFKSRPQEMVLERRASSFAQNQTNQTSNGNSKVNGLANGHSKKKKKKERSKHPKEEPFTSMGDYGKMKFRFEKPDHRFVTEEGDSFCLHDLYTHSIIFGESGCGKTSFILNQVYEELFRCTHLKDGADRDRLTFGGIVIEAKGDFAPKTWDLAVKYGRADDVLFFGPTHLDNVYDPFADDTESPQQQADKLQAVMEAFSGGQKDKDPFFTAASRKLFTQICLLHRKLKDANTPDLPKLSFSLLNLLLLDKGTPRNQGAIDRKAKLFQETYEKFNQQMDRAKTLASRLAVECSPLTDKVEAAVRAAQDELKEINETLREAGDDPAQRRQLSAQKETAQRKVSTAGNLRNLLRCEEEGEYGERLVPRLERLKKNINGMSAAKDDYERGRHYDSIIENAGELSEVINARIGLVTEAVHVDHPENLKWLKNALLDLIDALEKINAIGDQLANWQAPEPEQGMLKQMLGQYEQIIKTQGGNPAQDPVVAYFYEEHLNPANDRTSGSVSMTASNLVNLFVHPPFSQIFSDHATFSMESVIDEGKIIVLDIPQAKYGVIMNVSSLLLKVDFYRAVLSRKVLYMKDPRTGEQRLVNQDRPLTYFCDEFASVVSTGDTTGEAGFMDKCREYKCACILAVQSKPLLEKKLAKEAEVDAILTNCGIKMFMRNTDEKTTKMASQVLGNEVKVNPYGMHSPTEHTMQWDKPIGARGFSSSFQRQARFDQTKFSELKNGEAIVKLNPRFGMNQVKRVTFLLHIIKSIDKDNLMPFPIVTEVQQQTTNQEETAE